MRRALLFLAVLVTACGRIAFDSSVDALITDGSTDDVLASDANDASAPTCLPQHLLCDHLDDPINIGTTPWNDIGGTWDRDTTIAHRGASSIHFVIPFTPMNTQSSAYFAHVGPAISNATELWVRAWVRMSALPVSTNAMELLTLQQSSGLGVFVFIRSDKTQLYHQFDTANGETTTTPPLDTWFCLVWHLQLEPTSIGASELTSDVLPTFSITNSITQGSPPMDTFSFGPFFATNNVDVDQPPLDVWVDDILVDDAPVTCND